MSKDTKDTTVPPVAPPLSMEERMMAFQERQLAIQEAQLEAQKTSQEVQRAQLKQTRKRSNEQGPDASVYNPRGQKDYPMPDLACEVLMPWPLRPGFMHGLTREEVLLMNMVRPGEYVLELLDGTPVQCCVLGTKNSITGKIERLAFMGQRDAESNTYSTLFSKERRTSFPSMVNTLKQILDQQGVDYSDVMSMKEELARIKLPETDPKHLPISVGE